MACALGGSAAPGRAGAVGATGRGVLTWGPGGCWVQDRGGALHGLQDRLAAGIDPVATIQGLWLVTESGALHCWQQGGDGSWQLRCTVEFGAPVHALSASADGRWVLAAHAEQLSLLDQHGEVAKVFDGTDLQRKLRGAATALFALAQRRSLVVAWPALGELWEISLDPKAAPIFDGLVHDYRMSEGIAQPGYLGARRSPLGRPMPAFNFADSRVPWLAGTQDEEVIVAHLDVRRRIAALRGDAANPAGAVLRPAPGGPGTFEWWLPAGDEVHVFDTARWARLAVHRLPGPVRQVQAVAGAVWALVGERASAALYVLPDAPGPAWQRVDGVAGHFIALRAEGQGSTLLALRADPPALLLLDGGGSVLNTWPMPRAAQTSGAAWFPTA
jgi:hypothetical protein